MKGRLLAAFSVFGPKYPAGRAVGRTKPKFSRNIKAGPIRGTLQHHVGIRSAPLAISGPLSDFLPEGSSPPVPEADWAPRRHLRGGGRPSILAARRGRKNRAATNSP